jgi:acyl carrier protein
VNVLAQVRGFITDNFYVADPSTLADDASLLDAGIVDSTGVLEVVHFVETELGVDVHDDEIVPENVDSIARIAAFIERKRSGLLTSAA